LQRIAMLLLFNAGKPGQALQSIGRAREFYQLAEDHPGVGKTYVDEAVVHNNCGEHRLARRAYRESLRFLPEEDLVYRYSALQGLAVAAVFLGDVDEATGYLEQAMAVLHDDEQSLFLRSFVRWLQGELSLLLGQYGQASDHFVAVWDTYLDLDVGPLEVTLISLRIAKAYWLQGDRAGFRQILQELASRAEELQRSSPVFAPVLTELLRESAEGTVTADLLEAAYLKMREGAPNAPPLLASRLPG
jgi:tetratricopeptide (TPR) repeat protein